MLIGIAVCYRNRGGLRASAAVAVAATTGVDETATAATGAGAGAGAGRGTVINPLVSERERQFTILDDDDEGEEHEL